MSDTKMLINYVPGEECRVAVVSEGRLEELHHERATLTSLVGNIYVAKVMNVEPSIQAAFVDFGTGNNGFLHVSDVHPQYFPGEDDETVERIGKKTPRRERPPIQQCLKRGQEILVQVLKEGISTKGPTLTSYLSIPGRYLVMLPQMDKSGVSKKVEDEDARKEMKAVLDQLELPEGFGFIVRTAGIGRNKTDLKRDLAYLQRLWTDIEKRQNTGSGPRLLYAESDLLMRALRDIWNSEIGEIVIDNESAIRRAARFMKIVSPRGTTKLLHYDLGTPMFHAFGIEEQIERIHAREVPLPSGGYLVIDEAEALVAVDVNSGKSRESRDSETNAFRTNQEAVDEICRQLKLRDVGGLVLCDLIDMANRKNRKDIENQFKERLKRDRAATRTLPVSEFGIVEMTRQRMKGSFQSHHFAGCPACQGRGKLRRPDSVSGDAMRELQALLDRPQVAKVEMVVSPRMAGELLSSKRQAISRLEFHSKKHVDVRVSDAVAVDRVTFYAYDANNADLELEKMSKAKPPKDLPQWQYAVSGKDEPEHDWSVDTAREHSDLPPELVEEPRVDENDLISDEGESDDEGWVTEKRNQGAGGAGGAGQNAGADGLGGEGAGRRGRRRRRRGRGGRGGENGAAPMQAGPAGTPIHEPAAAGQLPLAKPVPEGGFGSWDVAPGEAVPSGGGAANGDRSHSSDDVQAGGAGEPREGEGGGRRRRRRRRGRGGRGGEGQAGGPPGTQSGGGQGHHGQPGAPAGTPVFEDGEAPEADDNVDGSRGDSWDEPAPARATPVQSQPQPQPVRKPMPQPAAQARPAAPRPAAPRPAAPRPPQQRPMVLRKRVKLDEFFRPVVDANGEPVYEEVLEPAPIGASIGAPVEAKGDAPSPLAAPSSEGSEDAPIGDAGQRDGEAAAGREEPIDEADADDDVEGDDEHEADGDAAVANGTGAGADGVQGTGKKRRRRRGRRGKGGPRPDGQPGAAPGEPPARSPQNDRNDRNGPGERGGRSESREPRGTRPPMEVKTRPQPAPPALSPAASAPAPAAGPSKGFRPLYGAGRGKLSPSKAASAAKTSRE
ncbi:MAG: Rne/Rng family ribonuclease [Phycisphaerales bacterium]